MFETKNLLEITQQLGGEVVGDCTVDIVKVGSLNYAQKGAITFFNDTKYTAQLVSTSASAVILKSEHAQLTDLPKIITDNPYAFFAKVSSLLNPVINPAPGIHPTAYVDSSVSIPASCSVGPNVVIEHGVVLKPGVVVSAGSVIERNSKIGEHTILETNVTIKHGVQIGHNCHIFSGAVIGNDGFGYAETTNESGVQQWVKIPQVGQVVIGNHVDIGSNTTVDRGAIDDTVIKDGVKIDNLVQIAHNCIIGAHTVIAGCVGIAGSATIGSYCKIGGAAMILGHLNIADGVTISPGSMITRSIKKSGKYTALMPFQEHHGWLKTAANIRQLGQVTSKIKQLDGKVKQLQQLQNSEESEK